MNTALQVHLSTALPIEDREAVVLLLRQHLTVEEETARDLHAVWHIFSAFIQDNAATGALLYAGAKGVTELADKLIALRDKLRAGKQPPPEGSIKLALPGETPVDLTTASPEQVRAQLSRLADPRQPKPRKDS
jgi:hypothetical protein